MNKCTKNARNKTNKKNCKMDITGTQKVRGTKQILDRKNKKNNGKIKLG